MPKIHVHDFSFDYIELKNKVFENDFFCGIRVYFNFSPDDPGDGWENLEFFNLSVGTPFGFANYIKRCIDYGNYPKKNYFANLLIVDNGISEDEIMESIKSTLQSLYGKNENELILKAMKHFGWEGEENSDQFNRLFN
jgi:hypothetical protein